MAENENSITTYFRADISNFSASTQQLNRYISSVNSEFNNTVAGLGKWSDSQTGLTAKITQLNKVLEAEKKKLGDLESAYAEMVAAGKENTAEAQKLAIKLNEQSAKVKKAEADVGRYSDALKELQDAGVETKQELDELNKEIEENGKATEETSGKLGGFAKGIAGVAAAAVAAVGSFLALAESTREYRNEMAKLDTAFQTSGHSAATAEKTYKELYSILGDEGRATEAAQQLAKMSKDEADLAANTRILTGVMAEYGDSIPTEGLAEGMAATAAMGEVQGVLADALEWQGVNLDDYNAELATMTTEEERAAHIQKTLTELYGASADAFAENNKEIIEAREAQAELTDATAEFGAVAEPISTILKQIGTSVLKELLPYVKDLANVLQTLFKGDITGGVTQLGDFLNTVTENVTTFFSEIANKLSELLPQVLPKIVEVLSGIIQTLVSALPEVVAASSTLLMGIVSAIGPTVVALVNELPKIIDSLISALSVATPTILSTATEAFMSLVSALRPVLAALIANLPKILGSIIDFLTNDASTLFSHALEFFMKIVDAIPTFVAILAEDLPAIINTIIHALVKAAPKIFSTALDMLGQIVDAIPSVSLSLLKSVPQIIASIVKGFVGAHAQMFNIGVDLIKGLWDGFASMIDWIWSRIKNFFNKTIVGGVKKLLGINSPSKVFTEMGEYSAEGYLIGYEKKMADAGKTLSRINYAGALGGMTYGGAVPAAAGPQNNYYNINQTFERMESTLLAQHRAKIELVAALQGVK